MKRTNIFFILSLGIFILSLYLLATASPALNYPLGKDDTLPLGNFITWVGLIALPMALYWGVGQLRTPGDGLYKILSSAVKALIFLSILWLPISYMLAGNMNFNFGEVDAFQGGQLAMKLFWGLSMGIPLSVLLLFLLHILIRLIRTFR
jgi:hypothetical protein